MITLEKRSETQAAHSFGFTLIELLIATSIITVATSLLLPAVQKVREMSNEEAARDYCLSMASQICNYYEENGTYPGKVTPGNTFWASMVDNVDSNISRDETIIFSGYEFSYIAADGFYGLKCTPVYPGLTGSVEIFYQGEVGSIPQDDDIYLIDIEEASENREYALHEIRRESKQLIAKMYQEVELIADASEVILPNGDLTAKAIAEIDANGDLEISFEELCGKESILPGRLTKSMQRNLKLGTGNERIDLIPSAAFQDVVTP